MNDSLRTKLMVYSIRESKRTIVKENKNKNVLTFLPAP